tara:strand:- start:4511 stop:5104 length:594 start_codon:yes stop_codon:yes gene_type:complete
MTTPKNFYTNIYLRLPAEVIKHIVGKGGQGFVQMSDKLDLDYIWYNQNTNAITLYGECTNLEFAKAQMCEHIEAQVLKHMPSLMLQNKIYNTNPMSEELTNISLRNVIDREHVKHLIGAGGNNFKRVTKATNVYFIWYNEEEHQIKIWGTDQSSMLAVKSLYEIVNSTKEIIERYSDQPAAKKPKIHLNTSNNIDDR